MTVDAPYISREQGFSGNSSIGFAASYLYKNTVAKRIELLVSVDFLHQTKIV
jgi:hypothetical protein